MLMRDLDVHLTALYAISGIALLVAVMAYLHL